MIAVVDGHDILVSLSQYCPHSKKTQDARDELFLEGGQSIVVVFQWLHVLVVKPSHGKAICGEHHRAGHIEAETAVLYG